MHRQSSNSSYNSSRSYQSSSDRYNNRSESSNLGYKHNDTHGSSSRENYRSSTTSSYQNPRSDYQSSQQPSVQVAPSSMNHSDLNRMNQLAKLNEINSLQAPNWSQVSLKPFEKRFYTESRQVLERSQAEINNYLQQNNITVSGNQFIRPVLEFSDLDLPKIIQSKIIDLNFSQPTQIQSMCWPILLSGSDMVGIAQTGSGKTLGFVLPMLTHIINNSRYVRSFGRDDTPGPFALVVAPTRELAIQIQQVAEEFGSLIGIKNIVIYGGSPKPTQLQQIKRGADIYIATPGRLIDFVKDGLVNLNKCTFLVLDEADRMLDMGFEPQIRKIIEQIRPDRQTAMFSATWPKEVRKLAEDFIKDYITVNIGAGELTANPNITQIVEVVQDYEKEGKLKEILSQIMNDWDSKAIVFAETKKKVDSYSKYIQNLGYYCLTIHGDKKQQEREWVLNEFKKKPKSILCATDVAARGLNISDIKYVINIDYPMQTEDYIHRIGRTARSSNLGTAFTFITNDNARHLPKLVEILKESNQYISDGIMNLARAFIQTNAFKAQNKNQRTVQPQKLNQQEMYQGFKRESSDLNEAQANLNQKEASNVVKRIKKNRWDEPTTVPGQPMTLPIQQQQQNYQNGSYDFNMGYPIQHGLIPGQPNQTIPQPLLASNSLYQNYNNYY